VTRKKDSFTIARSEREATVGDVVADRFVDGAEAETTKTFRLPVRLSRALKIHAAQTGQTEKEILIRLISDYLDSNH
jgi:hypothetical protein